MNSINLVLVLAYCVSAVGFIKVYIYSGGVMTSAYYNKTFSFSVTFADENLNIPFHFASYSDVSACTRPQKRKASVITWPRIIFMWAQFYGYFHVSGVPKGQYQYNQ